MSEYWIVEHAARGCFTGFKAGKPCCSYKILRTDPKVHRFYAIENARGLQKQIKGSYVMHVTLKPRLKIERVE